MTIDQEKHIKFNKRGTKWLVNIPLNKHLPYKSGVIVDHWFTLRKTILPLPEN